MMGPGGEEGGMMMGPGGEEGSMMMGPGGEDGGMMMGSGGQESGGPGAAAWLMQPTAASHNFSDQAFVSLEPSRGFLAANSSSISAILSSCS